MSTELPEYPGYGQVVGLFRQSVAGISDVEPVPYGVAAAGNVIFTPMAEWLTDVTAAPPVTITQKPIECTLDENGFLIDPDGNLGVWLRATDDPDLNPRVWTYHVRLHLDDVQRRTFFMELPEGTTQDLAELTPVAGSAGDAIVRGPVGDNAYEVAVTDGFVGTKTEWVASLKGDKGDDSTVPGPANTLTAGTVSTLSPGSSATSSISGQSPEQTLTLGIPQGDEGDSAYQVAVSQGFVGSEAAWLASLRGPAGVGVADITTDLTVGTRVFVGDVMVHGDTGARIVPGNITTNHPGITEYTIQRTNNTVTVSFKETSPAASGDGITTLANLPAGFRIASAVTITGNLVNAQSGGPAQKSSLYVSAGVALVLYRGESIRHSGSMTFLTNDPWPNNLPGLPA